MNKNQFLSELNQYLTFVTAEERALVMEEYQAKFDHVGEDGEAALILSLGTPMLVAIQLKRLKEAGKALTESEAPAHAPASPAPSRDVEPEDSASVEEAAADDAATEADAGKTKSGDAESGNDESGGDEAAPSEPEEPFEKAKPRAGAVISCVLLSLLTVIAALAVICVGAYFIIVMGNLLVTALQSFHLLNNALLLFGISFISGAIGIVIVWLGIWAAIRIISKLVSKARS